MQPTHFNPYTTLSQIFGHEIKSFDDCFEQLKNEHSFDRLDNPDCQEALTTIADQKGKTVLMRAIDGCYLPLAERLIEANVGIQNTDRKGNTAYHTAAKCGEVEIIRKLLTKLSLNEPNTKTHTPLISAIRKKQANVVKLLIENGANLTKPIKYKELEVTPLEFAAICGELESIRILLEKTSIEKHNTSIPSLLHLAIRFQQNHVLEYLLTKIPSEVYIETKDRNGYTPLAYAELVDNSKALALLKEYEAKLEPINHENYRPTPLTDPLLPEILKLVVTKDNIEAVSDLLLSQANWDFSSSQTPKNDLKRASSWKDLAKYFIIHPIFGNLPSKTQAKIHYHLGEVRLKKLKYENAYEHLRQALEIQKQEKNKNIGDTLSMMGRCYYYRGKFSKALKKHEQALEIDREVHGDRHPYVARSLNNIGGCYLSQGKYNEAQEKHEQALEIYKEVLGNHHPDVALSLSDIGRCYYYQEKYNEALEKFEEGLEIYKEAQGDRHPDVARSLGNIGNYYLSQGKYNEALEKHEEALEIDREVQGDRHPDVARSLNNIGSCYLSQGKYNEALEKHEQALEIYKEVHGNHHPDVAICLNNIGNCYLSQEKYDEALEMHEQALEIYKEVHGNHHPNVAICLNNIAGCYFSQGEYSKALEKHEEALEIDRDVYGDRHPNVARSLGNIGAAYYKLGTRIHAQEVKIKKAGEDRGLLSIDHKTLLEGLGLSSQEKYSEALEKYKEALEIYRDVHGDRDHYAAGTLMMIGRCYFVQGKHRGALEKFKEALEIYRDVHGDRDHSEASALAMIGHCYFCQGKYSEALEKFEEALEIYREVHGDHSSEITELLCNIKDCKQHTESWCTIL